jgi:heptosyltransferase I
MKRVLLIKFTSLGDLIHALPALTDAARAHPGLKFDWMIDESFAEIAKWHNAVDKVFVTSHRTWRRGLFAAIKPIFRLIRNVRQNKYDLIIDGQGNFKTALMSLCMREEVAGFDRKSAREWVASFAYGKKYKASRKAHAINRLRQLFALSLGYSLPKTPPDFGIDRSRFSPLPIKVAERYIVFIHNAAWKTKIWPEEHGKKLVEWITKRGYTVYLPWGNEEEKERALRLSRTPLAVTLPKMSLSEIGSLLTLAKACVSMDTGLSHLAAALHIPSITLYGATDSGLIGASGENQIHLASKLPCSPCNQKTCRFTKESPPCLGALTPEMVFERLQRILEQGRQALSICNT